jgi:PAT family beta-lactamase induction signal transducer AmpG
VGPVSAPSLWASVVNPRMGLCILTGFSSGLPLYVLYQLVPAWLRDADVDLATIGLFSLIAFPYTWKFLWSPLMDRWAPPLGRRRGWALITQLGLLVSLAAFALCNPSVSTGAIAAVAAVVALFSASQDIVLDAYRREILPDHELGLGNSMFVNAYRVSSLVPGSLALILADQLPWSQVNLVVASFMGVGLLTTWLMPEPTVHVEPPPDLRAAVVEPFREFFGRNGVRSALLLLTFMLLYKLGDSMATALATPFYLDVGFSMTQIGTVAKGAALWSAVTGGVLGGLMMVRAGIQRSLWLFGVVQLASILGFAVLSEVGPDARVLFAVVSFEYLGVGLGTAALVAFIARSTHRAYTATQLALLTSLTGVPRTFANAATGYIVESIGYTSFFLLCAALSVPGMLLLPWVAPWGDDPPTDDDGV